MYYRRFTPHYGLLAKPMTKMTCKPEPERVQWTSEGGQAFVELCKSLCNSCLLISDTYHLHTDVSGLGVGVVLSVIRQDEELPVAYYSRQLHGAENHYSASELECLAVVKVVKHFEVYLMGKHFQLITDHQALQGMTTSKNQNKRLTRLSLFLQDYVTYRPGPENSNADGLSRQCWALEEEMSSGSGGGAPAQEGGDVATRHKSSAGGNPAS